MAEAQLTARSGLPRYLQPERNSFLEQLACLPQSLLEPLEVLVFAGDEVIAAWGVRM